MSQDSRHGLAGTEVTDNAGKRGRDEATPGRYRLFTAGYVFREFIFLVVHFYTVLLRDECLQT